MALTKVQGLGLGSLDDNITFSTAGKGVHLGVTSATSSNLQDDYEEGTWTPTVSGLTLTASTGHYVKIGKVVNFGFSVQVPSNSASTHFKINNPPFNPHDPGGAGNNFGGALNFANANLANCTVIVTTGNDIQFYRQGASFVEHGDVSNGTVVASGAYLVA
tara:strand:+ start:1210 stop:1692 length:483 start_codon:yes stop_codon:yes gene_type:complete